MDGRLDPHHEVSGSTAKETVGGGDANAMDASQQGALPAKRHFDDITDHPQGVAHADAGDRDSAERTLREERRSSVGRREDDDDRRLSGSRGAAPSSPKRRRREDDFELMDDDEEERSRQRHHHLDADERGFRRAAAEDYGRSDRGERRSSYRGSEYERDRGGDRDRLRGSSGDPRARGTPVGSGRDDWGSPRGGDPYYRGSSGRDYERDRGGRRPYPDYDMPPHHMDDPYYGGDYDVRPPSHRSRRDDAYRSRSPPYRESGRDMFGRDWPPPGRGSYADAPSGREGREPYGRPSSPPSRRSYPPSDRGSRGGDWGRSPSNRGERESRDRDWGRDEPSDRDRRPSHEDDLYSQPLKSYKQWLELQDDGILPQEAARKYEDYKSEYMKKLSHNFFTSHKDEDWFKEKYHPEALEKKRQELAARAQKNYATFSTEYEEGKIDVNSIETELYYSEEASRKRKEGQAKRRSRSAEEGEAENEDESKQTKSEDESHDTTETSTMSYDIILDHLLDAKKLNATSQKEVEAPRDPNTLYIKHIPPKGSREELQSLFEQSEGFVKLIVTEPRKFQNFQRMGWVIYDSPDACRAALTKFNGHRLKEYDLQLGLAKPSGTEGRSRVRIVPPVADEDARVRKDASTSNKIMQILDKEHEVDSSGLFGASHDRDEDVSVGAARAELNRNILYLRRVHLYCYYCAEQFDSEEELHRMCGEMPHLRAKRREDHDATAEEASWLTYLEAKLEQRLSAPPPEVYTAKASIDRELEGFFDVKIKQEDANKFRCMVPKCNKLFMTAEFVKKHLRLKHQDLINQIKEKAVNEHYFQNYLSDPRRILPSMPEAKLSARPERGERERRGGEGDRYGGLDAYGPGIAGDRPALIPRGPPPIVLAPPMHRGPYYPPRPGMPLAGVGPYAPPVYPPFARPPGPPMYRGRGGGYGGGRGGRFGGAHHRPGYVDLDAPPEDASLGEQRTTIDYGDLDTVPEPPPSIALDTSTSSAVTASPPDASSSSSSSDDPSAPASTENDSDTTV